MTWKEFKEAVEAQGVKDDTEISYIDVQGEAVHVLTGEQDGQQQVQIT